MTDSQPNPRRLNKWFSAALAASMLLLPLAARAAADNPFEQAAVQSFQGLFTSSAVKLRLTASAPGLSGDLEFSGNTFTVKADVVESRAEGIYSMGTTNWPVTLARDGAQFVFTAGKYKATLQKAVCPNWLAPIAALR